MRLCNPAEVLPAAACMRPNASAMCADTGDSFAPPGYGGERSMDQIFLILSLSVLLTCLIIDPVFSCVKRGMVC